jgi:ATP-dependent RNA circularization protein (DNA/RNA ligase family)
MRKYPRTQHIEGSKLQPGDEDLSQVSLADLAGRHLVVEEKVDGANSAISFDDRGGLLLQSRGHYLAGGPRERHFDLFKQWAAAHRDRFHNVMGSRYIVYGEWLYARHTMAYDRLPHYFLEFDVLDRDQDRFLSTPRRRALLADLPIEPVHVVAEGRFDRLADLMRLVGPSKYKSVPEPHMEGLYIKWEEDGEVKGRYKWIRAGFLAAVLESGGHWLDRPIEPNLLRDGVDIFR